MDDLTVTNISLPLLNEKNYPEWVVRMEAYLTRKGLYSNLVVIDEDEAEESVRESPTLLKAWVEKRKAGRTKSKMQEARAEIILKVDDAQLSHFTSQDPLEMWQDLARVHVARGFATRLSLRRQFSRLTKKPTESMTAWIGRVKKLSFRLASSGITVTDEDKILALTNGLPDGYDSLIVALDATPAEQLTLLYVTDRLINEEVRREEKVEHELETAYLAKKNGASSSPRTCWGCGEVGHIKPHCKNTKKEEAHSAVHYSVQDLRDLGASQRMPGVVL